MGEEGKTNTKTSIGGCGAEKNKKSGGGGSIHEEIDPLPSGVLDLEVEVPSKAGLRCYGCYEFGNLNILRCACQCTYFCSKECQRKSWVEHKAECAPIRSHFKEEREQQRKHLELAAELIEQEASSPSSSSTSFTCSVCLDDKQEGNQNNTLLLPCGHRFCYPCIRDVQYSAFIGNDYGSCPQCREPLPYLEHVVADRVLAITKLARTKFDKQDRDEVCKVAMQLLDFWLAQEPGRPILQMLRGNVYSIMEEYDQALISYKKAYNVHKRMYQEFLLNPTDGTVSSREQYDERLQQVRDQTVEEPATDFPQNSVDLEKEIVPFFGLDPGILTAFSELFLGIGRAFMHCANDHEDKVAAAQLIRLVQKLNKPLASKCDGCRPLDIDCNKALAECLLSLGKLDEASALARKVVRRFRFHPGLHMILAECERERGDLEKALFYSAKGYFYEEAWNEVGTRAKNLQLWNDIRQSMGQKHE